MRKVKITDLCYIQVGKTPLRANQSYWGEGFPWLSIADMNQGVYLEKTKETITQTAIDECNCKIVPEDTVLYSFKLSIGKVGITKIPIYTNEAIAAFRIKDFTRIKSKYLYYALMSADYSTNSNKAVMGKTLNKTLLEKFEIPITSIEEQIKIIELLDKMSKIISDRKQAIKLVDEYIKSVFFEMFGDPVLNPKKWDEQKLSQIADIISGVTKGRKFSGTQTIRVPYMRVANVQDGIIDLSEVKDIEVLPSDANRYKLIEGDVLLTEGGDPDKLGRGGIWKGQIKNCIHQNHIFRVRLNQEIATPEFMSALIGSSRGKQYFLRSAKQTTGIASINMTQLKNFSVLVPSINLQMEFSKIVNQYNLIKEKMMKQSFEIENNFQSLLHQSFSIS